MDEMFYASDEEIVHNAIDSLCEAWDTPTSETGGLLNKCKVGGVAVGAVLTFVGVSVGMYSQIPMLMDVPLSYNIAIKSLSAILSGTMGAMVGITFGAGAGAISGAVVGGITEGTRYAGKKLLEGLGNNQNNDSVSFENLCDYK
ncbi:hypothetical protein HOK51_02185 [Candidatus Woesearchaeota archaeon]|jgi:hypothetical protein|nr:hypothetical protein [Candidatus Woesearchaeota archaeon]MBT6518625.1 hypothetical protein [Candidatus Woesearchaeota archaeon]MBT7368050.1 hypothetical protein [Candidatus Woesearchaeota archaeon]